MKNLKLIHPFFIVATTLLFISSCGVEKKDSNSNLDNSDKVLSFDNWNKVQETIIEHLTMTQEEKIKWDDKEKFSSQYSLFNKIIKEEEKSNSFFFTKYNKSKKMSDEDINDQYHSIIYKKFVEEKKVFEIISNDSTELLEYKLYDKSLSPVLNLSGLIKVNDTLYKILKDSIMIKPPMKENTKSTDWISFVTSRSSCGNFGESVKTFNETFNKRVRVWVEGNSRSCNCTPVMYSTYQFRASAEKLVWSPTWSNWTRYVWKRTNNYAPCINVFGKWRAKFNFSYDKTCFDNFAQNYNGCSSSNNSPLNFSASAMNYLIVPLCPNGGFSVSSPNKFMPPGLTVTDKEFYFSICGIGDNTIGTASCSPNAEFSINNSQANPVNVNSNSIIINGYGSTSCSGSFFISIQESDQNWNRYGIENFRWLTASDYSNYGNIANFNLNAFNNSFPAPINLQSGKYYRIKLAVGNPWHSKTILIRIN